VAAVEVLHLFGHRKEAPKHDDQHEDGDEVEGGSAEGAGEEEDDDEALDNGDSDSD